MPVNQISSPYKGCGSLTREQFLFYEMRTTAKLMKEGLSDQEIYEKIREENLFQYPTEKSIQSLSKACIARLRALDDLNLVEKIVTQPSDEAKQICLYAMMKQYRLVWDFMINVIGEKYRTQNFSFNRSDVTVFFMQLQEQDDYMAEWTESTIKKVISVLIRILIETGYLDNNRANHINPVLLSVSLENAIRSNNDQIVLPAFNTFA